MTSFLTTALKVLAWIALGGAAAVFLFSLVSESLSAVLGAFALVVGVVGFLIFFPLGLLLDHVVEIREQVRQAERVT